jgi:cytidylate kinase
MRRVVLVTGMQAAGKTTIGPRLAARMSPPAAAFDGDVFHRMVVAGRVNMTPEPQPEALRQLRLRYRTAGLVAQHYVDNGFDFVYTDIVLGADVSEWLDARTNAQRHLVVLVPTAEAIAERERERDDVNSYRDWQKPGMSLIDAIRVLQDGLADIPRRGLWIDTSELSIDETVEAIVRDGMRSSRY